MYYPIRKTDNDLMFEKRMKIATEFKPQAFLIRNDLDAFRRQLPVFPADLAEKNFENCKTTIVHENLFHDVLPVEYQSWENSIVYHSNSQSTIIPSQAQEAGWIPTRTCRTLASYQSEILGRNVDYIENPRFDDRDRANHWFSIFPFHDTIVFKNLMSNDNFLFDLNHEPKFTDPRQDTVVSGLPPEPQLSCVRKEKPSHVNPPKSTKESRLHRTRHVLARAGLVSILTDDDNEHHYHRRKYKEKPASFWNLSLDHYYDTSGEYEINSKRQNSTCQHTLTALNFDFNIFPRFRSADELRYFHRPSFQQTIEQGFWTPIQIAIDQNVNQSLRTSKDLTGTFGELLLFEYSEQYPALLNEIGMWSTIRTYVRPQHFQADASIEVELGELVFTHASPFLWPIPRNCNIQTLENNMFTSPIYRQSCSNDDFLLILSNHGFFIQTIPIVFIVGHQCPSIEVPVPQSKRVSLLQRDLLQMFIYRLFWQSNETPRRIRIDDIKRAFPRLAESSIRKRLKASADFRRAEDCNSWILKHDFRLPSEDEIRDLIKPEIFCAYASMTAAEQRLKDTGLADKYYFDEQTQHSSPLELDEEILQAPWNTTRTYLEALRGKCSMQIFGIGAKNIHKTRNNTDLKRCRRAVTGTDADLRRLQLKDARKLLLKFDISEKIIQSLSRWEIVDLVRTLSTQKAKEGNGGVGGIIKFARGAQHQQAQQCEKYKEDSQRQFELENRLFVCTDEQMTDEDTPDEDDELLDEMSQTLEYLLRTSNINSDEYERQQAKEIISQFDTQPTTLNRPKMLRITRTFIDDRGESYECEELVRNNESIIEAYVRIRETKDEKFIKAYYALNEIEREMLRRERRRLQEQLRRVKRNEVRFSYDEIQHHDSINITHSNTTLSDLDLSTSEDDNDLI